MYFTIFFFFKHKTAYEMRISDWSSDVCSSDLREAAQAVIPEEQPATVEPVREPARSDRPDKVERADRSQHAGGHDRGDPEIAADRDQMGLHQPARGRAADEEGAEAESGRASCRERVCQYGEISVVGVE